MTFAFDPYDPALFDDPTPAFRVLREDHPAYWNHNRGFWVLSRFEDVWQAVRDPVTFCSGSGITLLDEQNAAAPPMLLTTDPPHHGELRASVNRAFTPRRVAELEDHVREQVTLLLDRLVDAAGRGDLVTDFAAPLPTTVFEELLGVPAELHEQFAVWSEETCAMSPDPVALALGVRAMADLARMFEELVEERRRAPQDDLISALVAGASTEGGMSHDELIGFCVLLLTAGLETTAAIIAAGALRLAQHPDQRALLAADRSAIPRAVEEMLRFDTPIAGNARTLTCDIERHGRTMHAGEKVQLLFAAANRDDREFPDGDRFDVTRQFDLHLAFGHGIHFCVGAALARLETRVAFEELLGRFPDHDLATTCEWTQLIPTRAPVSLPIQLR